MSERILCRCNTVAGLEEGMTGHVYNPEFAVYNETVSVWEETARKEEARYLETRK